MNKFEITGNSPQAPQKPYIYQNDASFENTLDTNLEETVHVEVK